jgi:acetyltransferase
MSTYRLDKLFAPRSIALVGASPRRTALSHALLANLKRGGFAGPIHLVNPHHTEIDGLPCVPRIADIAVAPDVAIFAAPAALIPDLVEEAAMAGVAAAIVVPGGLMRGPGSPAEAMKQRAHRHGLRILGPNSLGLIAPAAQFDASFFASLPAPGDLAVISQSGAVAGAMIEWARRNAVGFSALVTLGEKVDIDFGDCLDYFAEDRHTRAILLYVETLTAPQKFMSAARAAARTKPVVVVRSGRHEIAAQVARSQTGALAGEDAVFDAACRRAGLLRVLDLDDLFAAAETLSRVAPFQGDRLAIMTNGGGLGALAVDRLQDFGGRLSTLDEATLARLAPRMPAGWRPGGPVDVAGAADRDCYEAVLAALLDDPHTDAVLVVNCPTVLVSSRDVAAGIAATVKAYRARSFRPKPVFAVWLRASAEADALFAEAQIPNYDTEVDAISGIMHLVHYRQAQQALMETPPSLPADFTPDPAGARAIVAGALKAGRQWLDPIEVTGVLEAYRIPIAPVRQAADARQAGALAESLIAQGQAVVLKIVSQQILHKSDIGGVALGLTSRGGIEEAAEAMLQRVRAAHPNAVIDGFAVQPMIHRPHGRELIAGLAEDLSFGPIVVFGHGGAAVEVIDDKALALPPLDLRLARDLIARTRVSRLLGGYRGVPPADLDAVALTLVKLAQLSADVPEIMDLDLNPLIADNEGVLALDARIRVAAPAPGPRRQGPNPRFAVKPYPKEWERDLVLKDGWRVFVRPVQPEDERLYPAFFKQVTAQDLRLRFFGPIKAFSHAFIARLTQIDYARAIAFVALDPASGELLGVVRLHADANHEEGEYAILLRSDLKGRGLGWALMQLMIEYARADGLARVTGQILRENTTMIAMCEALGFTVGAEPDDPDLKLVTLKLADTPSQA